MRYRRLLFVGVCEDGVFIDHCGRLRLAVPLPGLVAVVGGILSRGRDRHVRESQGVSLVSVDRDLDLIRLSVVPGSVLDYECHLVRHRRSFRDLQNVRNGHNCVGVLLIRSIGVVPYGHSVYAGLETRVFISLLYDTSVCYPLLESPCGNAVLIDEIHGYAAVDRRHFCRIRDGFSTFLADSVPYARKNYLEIEGISVADLALSFVFGLGFKALEYPEEDFAAHLFVAPEYAGIADPLAAVVKAALIAQKSVVEIRFEGERYRCKALQMAGQFALKSEIPRGVFQFLVFAYKDPVCQQKLAVVKPDPHTVHLQSVVSLHTQLQLEFVDRNALTSERDVVGILLAVSEIGAVIVKIGSLFPGVTVVRVEIDFGNRAAVLADIIICLDLDIQLDLVHRPLIDIPGPLHQFFVEIQIDRFPVIHLAVSDKTYRIHKFYPGVVGRYLNSGEIPC